MSENIPTLETLDTSPFKRLVLSFGGVPSDFKESMTYYELLAWLCNYLETQVLPKVNETIEKYDELIDAFNTLKTYVDTYFENLDVQEEINNKLDAMAEDGTLAEIINQEIFGELNTKVTNIENDITDNIKPAVEANTSNITTLQTDTAKNTTDINNLKLKTLRETNYNRFHILSLPQMNSFFNNFQILESNEKKNYTINYNLSNFKNSGSSTVYIDPTASNDSSAGTEADPDYNLYRAMNHVSSTGTVILKEGIYRRRNFKMVENTASWLKSVNIIGQGKVILTNSDELSWSQNETYSNVYQATRTNIANVIDIRGYRDGNYCKLNATSSLSSCASTIGTYYYANNVVYVNIGETVTNNKIVVNLQTQNTPLNFSSSGEARKWYIENITCVSGDRHVIGVMSQTGTKGTFTAKDCKFLFANDTGENGNGICLYGVNSLLINCEASFNMSDGISYKGYSGFTPYGVEINCKAGSNGINNLASAYNTLQGAIDQYNEDGVMTISTITSLLQLEPQYLALLSDENGLLALNEEGLIAIAQQRIKDAQAVVQENAALEINAIVQGAVARVADRVKQAIDRQSKSNAIYAQSLAIEHKGVVPVEGPLFQARTGVPDAERIIYVQSPPQTAFPFVRNVVVCSEEDIHPEVFYICCISVRRGECGIAGIRFTGKGELHVRNRDVSLRKEGSQRLQEVSVVIFELPGVHHHVPDEDHFHCVRFYIICAWARQVSPDGSLRRSTAAGEQEQYVELQSHLFANIPQK